MVFACVVVGSRAYSRPARARRRGRRSRRRSSCWTFGEIYVAAVHPESYPSLGDLGFIAFYPLVYIGMVALLRAHARSIGGTLWLDGVTASLAAGALAAAVLVELVLKSTEGSTRDRRDQPRVPARRRRSCSLPIFGVFSLTALEARRRAGCCSALGVLATALADAIYLFQSSSGTYVEGTWIDILWPAALLLIASAAWAGDRSRARSRSTAGRSSSSRRPARSSASASSSTTTSSG